jgi:two-component system cell cycle response regulator DivK
MSGSINPHDAHILVVEDNVPNFVLIARLLAHMGVNHCEWKTSGWQVVQFADTLPQLDLILMDIRLPYEDGYQALRKIRSHPRLNETRVVAVTAEASEEEMKRLIQENNSPVLCPCSPSLREGVVGDGVIIFMA